jgi:leucyl/phenylalanyl-tRNA---protein transferase
MITWLEDDAPFPPLALALAEPNGLLCAGGELSPERIIKAYQGGIFPWFSDGDPILWWSPDPRMVLFPSEFKISRSLRKTLRTKRYEVRLDSAFAAVINACAGTARAGQDGTWITQKMQNAYQRLFELGVAHSVETWIDGKMAGGLYGLSIGRMFYGESMFSHITDASKIATAHLARFIGSRGFGMIDCQMNTPHLASLGAREIPRADFIRQLKKLIVIESPTIRWPTDGASQPWI